MTESEIKIPLRPGPGRVLLARNKVPDKINGIELLPEVRDRMERTNNRAQVLAIGPTEDTEPYFEVGDEVFVDAYAGYRLDVPGTDMILTVARFIEVMGVFTEPEPEPEPLLVIPDRRIIRP